MSRVVFKDGLKKVAKCFVILGEREALTPTNGQIMKELPESTHSYMEAIKKKQCDSVTAIFKDSAGDFIKYNFHEIPSEKNRNTGHLRVDHIYNVLSKAKFKEDEVQIIFALQNLNQVYSAGCTASKSFPLYTKKSEDVVNSNIQVGFSLNETVPQELYEELQLVGDCIRLCASLTDKPCGELNTKEYVDEILKSVKDLSGVKTSVIMGDQLKEQNFMGIWSVGKGSMSPPALVVLEYTPELPTNDAVIALVGKGIVYDSGGLSLKTASSMAGMKSDMAGSSACLSAFVAAVRSKYGAKLYSILAIAENAIGPGSQRVDDIYVAHSGLSVEVTNTDAEGRLVLADAISYATTKLNPTHVIDVATLTGAQLYVTGSKHAALMSPSENFEKLILSQGAESGDWCYPMIYAPEILNKTYSSPVADMRNTMKDNNLGANSSCAGNFIGKHINNNWKGEWAHLDIAYPARCDSRSTGYGVALLFKTLKSLIS